MLWLENIIKTRSEKENRKQRAIDTEKPEPLHCLSDISSEEVEKLLKIMMLENNQILADTLNEAVNAFQKVIVDNKHKIFDEKENEYNSFEGINEQTGTDLALRILFNDDGTPREIDGAVKESLRKTLNMYFCEAFRMFYMGNTDAIEDFNSIAFQTIYNMAVLSLLLIPNRSLSGEKEEHLRFYMMLLERIKTVLNANELLFFMSNGEAIDFIGANRKVSHLIEERYQTFISQIPSDGENDFDGISIGNTYFSSSDGMRCIKIVNTSNDNNREASGRLPQRTWYLAFSTSKEDKIETLLSTARNLLVMRDALYMRFKKDYDNNLYEEFADLRNKVIKLTDDKAGGHTPFAELSREFDCLAKMLINTSPSSGEREYISNQLKLVSELLISKLYVCHINEDSYPAQIEERIDDTLLYWLDDYKDILYTAQHLVLHYENNIDIVPLIKWDIKPGLRLELMNKTKFIWFSFIFALVLNAMRHGWAKSIDGIVGRKQVEITIRTDEEGQYLIIENYCLKKENGDKGITLESIKGYMNHFKYPFTSGKISNGNGDSVEDVYRFTAKVPLSRASVEREGEVVIK